MRVSSITTIIADKLKDHLDAPRWLIAFSGGVDSSVLLHALMHLKKENTFPTIELIHINHHLQSISDEWAKQAQKVADQYNITCHIIDVAGKPTKGASVEAWARGARYAAIESLMQVGDVALFGHHQQDQAETVINHMMRGSGLDGAMGMPIRRQLAAGLLVRPMLQIPQADIQTYAKTYDLHFIEDPSNVDHRYTRNYIRHQLLPIIESRWPAYQANLQRFAAHAASESALLETYLKPQYQSLLLQDGYALCISGLLGYDNAHINWFLRYWFKQLALPMPSEVQLNALKAMMQAGEDRQPHMQWSGHNKKVSIRRYRGALYILRSQTFVACEVESWMWQNPLLLANNISLNATALFSQKQLELLSEKPITLQWCEQGKTVKKYWQTKAVPPWCREYLPRFYQNGILLHEVDYKPCYLPWHQRAEVAEEV